MVDPFRHEVTRDVSKMVLVSSMESDGKGAVGKVSRTALSSRVDQLGCLKTVGQVRPHDAVVGYVLGLKPSDNGKSSRSYSHLKLS
jgi:hypothetical protein